MRINLVTPFAEKDAVKALGARWDAAKKVWYITNVEDLNPFRRWLPGLNNHADRQAGGHAGQGKKPGKVSAKKARRVFTGPVDVEPHCGCNVNPWEDCAHTVQAFSGPMSS